MDSSSYLMLLFELFNTLKISDSIREVLSNNDKFPNFLKYFKIFNEQNCSLVTKLMSWFMVGKRDF